MYFELYRGKKWNLQFIPRVGSFWVGAHYSKRYASWCIAPFPCIVFRLGKTDYLVDPGLFQECE